MGIRDRSMAKKGTEPWTGVRNRIIRRRDSRRPRGGSSTASAEPGDERQGQHRRLERRVEEPAAARIRDRRDPVRPQRPERQTEQNERAEADPPRSSPNAEEGKRR